MSAILLHLRGYLVEVGLTEIAQQHYLKERCEREQIQRHPIIAELLSEIRDCVLHSLIQMKGGHFLDQGSNLLLIENDILFSGLLDIQHLHVVILEVLRVIPVVLISIQDARQDIQVGLLLRLFILFQNSSLSTSFLKSSSIRDVFRAPVDASYPVS